MKIRHVLRTVPALAFLACVPAVSFSSDSYLSHGEASRAVSKLFESVGSAYECDISSISIEEVVSASGESRFYYVSFKAIGLQCNEAEEVLNYRGKSKGLWFNRRPKPKRIDKVPEEPNLDLIHEIDPEMDG